MQDVPLRHIWYTPEECAVMLDAKKYGDHWRAACPAHKGENTQALAIKQGHDKYGNPLTLMHCFAHGCAIEDICAAMGIAVKTLFCVHPSYAKEMRNAPRSTSPAIQRLRQSPEPYTPDEMAQIMLEDAIFGDMEWLQVCQLARAEMWRLAQGSAEARAAFTKALSTVHVNPTRFWLQLAEDMQRWGE